MNDSVLSITRPSLRAVELRRCRHYRMSMQTDFSASDLIRLLDLKPHPEGGHYRETLRDSRCDEGRAVSTAIYFLLAAGEESRWHRIDTVEVWH
jgi:predicted cupin superfamily sugar epimerase